MAGEPKRGGSEMRSFIDALKYCGFIESDGDDPFPDEKLWPDGPTYMGAIGVTEDWPGWESALTRFWRPLGEGMDEALVYNDRFVIIDRSRKRVATTCRCEPDGCALAAELVRAWFACGR